MTRNPLSALVLVVALLLAVVAGCQKSKTSTESNQPTPTSAQPATHRSASAGSDCLVDEYGIRKKVLIIEPGVRCRETAPNGPLTGEPLKRFFPYFVHQIADDGKWYRIGETPRRDSIKGWVSASVAVLWPTRLGAEYVPGYPLLIYRDKEALVELIRTGSTRAKPLARAVPSGRRKWMPWPIAENYLFEHAGKTYELVRLLFLGAYREGSSLAREERAPAGSGKDAAYSRAEVERIRAGVRRIDVVFVVDNTNSTGPFVQAIVRAVQRIARGLKESPFKPDVTFGLVLYRDYVNSILFRDGPGGGSVVKVFPFESDLEAFTRTVAPLKEAKHGSEGWPEAVYDGVEAGLTRLNWRGGNLSERALILIGDSSAHEPGHPQNPRNISARQLVELANERRVRIFSLAIRSGEPAEKKLQWQQYSHLSRQTRGDCYPLEDAGRVVEKINAIIAGRTEKVLARDTYVAAKARGKSDRQILGERLLDEQQRCEVVEFLRGAGIDTNRLAPGVPTFATGWCLVEVRGRSLLEKKVFIARAEMDLLMANLHTLNARLGQPPGVRQAVELAVGAREGSFFARPAGELPRETLDLFLRKKGIPSHQGLLRLTRAEVEHMPEERRAVLRERLSKQVLPRLVNACNDDNVFTWVNDMQFGWIKETLFP